MKKKLIILFLVIQLLNGVNYYINLPDYHVVVDLINYQNTDLLACL